MPGPDGYKLDVGQVAIIGVGLLGGSIGLGLRAAGYPGRIVGFGRRAETVARARQLGCIDEAAPDLGAALRDSGLAVIATPISAFADIFRQLRSRGHGHLVVTDVGSTKERVCAEARRHLSQPEPPAEGDAPGSGVGPRFVGSHPMAGSEQHGPEAATAGLLRCKPCIVTPESDTDRSALALVETLWSVLGMRVIRMPPDEHDRQVARVSHLPHALAVLLVELAHRQGGLEVASTGFRDTTRIASGDPLIWTDIFATNRQAMLGALEAFQGELSRFRQLLEAGRFEALTDLLMRSKDERDRWIGARGADLGGAPPGNGEG